jgi:hypothetical protein
MLKEYRPHPDFKYQVVEIGSHRQPVVVIDDAIERAEGLVDAAADTAFAPVPGYYPGIRAHAPPGYAEALGELLTPILQRAFSAPEARIEIDFSSFSLVTTRPSQLAPMQGLPHVDTDDPDYIAVLHYLCPAGAGGTAFYRHRRTGIDMTTTPEQLSVLIDALKEDVMAGRAPIDCYLTESSGMFERIAAFDIAFNRMLIYRGACLHSGVIPPGFQFSADPRRGRLTANTFLWLRHPSKPEP